MNADAIQSPMLGNQAANIVEQRIAYSGPVLWNRTTQIIPEQFNQSIWIPNNHPMRTRVQSELIQIRQKLKLSQWKPFLIYFGPLYIFVITVTIIYTSLKKEQQYKQFGLIDVAFLILVVFPTAAVIFCMLRVQEKDGGAIFREIETVNAKFVEEGINLVLRAKLGNRVGDNTRQIRRYAGIHNFKYIEVLQKHEVHEMS